MYDIECNGRKLARDKEGFLLSPDDWNDEVAEIIAADEGYDDFNEEKREIVKFMRNYYFKFHAFPILDAVCRYTGQERKCLEKEFINPMKAWKIAGLPKPDGIEFVTLDGEHYLMNECC
ncbi:MAG: TusE/DsrC/DsvC family sulfur relay protein [Thermodesulfobacteriota bacterium]